jgi:HSP20 family protein
MFVALIGRMLNQTIAKVALPGVSRSDITLKVHQTRLLIAAGSEGAAELLRHLEGDTHVVYRRDRATGGFFRSILLPNGIHADRIEAAYDDGILFVTVPAEDMAHASHSAATSKLSEGGTHA